MVRAPCCEKMGLKRGPWTPEEDHVLVSYITKHGHGNWRALPRLAGLLRCGKSCRLRWINYLCPDIKRGNFTSEEEETIINLHQMLGNRWSAIAAQLPGRTDNEIKNVWHTHLKKRVNYGSITPQSTKHKSKKKLSSEIKSNSKPIDNKSEHETQTLYSNYTNSTSLVQSGSEFSSCCTDSPTFTRDNNDAATEGGESGNGLPELPELDESFWSEALSMENPNAPMNGIETMPSINSYDATFLPNASNEDDMDFWLGVLLDSGDLKDHLPTF